jgi:hypothetical protein
MLRSMQELRNYTIGASDGDIGHIQGMLVDEVPGHCGTR